MASNIKSSRTDRARILLLLVHIVKRIVSDDMSCLNTDLSRRALEVPSSLLETARAVDAGRGHLPMCGTVCCAIATHQRPSEIEKE